MLISAWNSHMAYVSLSVREMEKLMGEFLNRSAQRKLINNQGNINRIYCMGVKGTASGEF